MPRKRMHGQPGLDRQPQRQQRMDSFQARDDFGDLERPRNRHLGQPDLDQQLQLQHQQMMENLQAQHREFMDAAWQAQMKYLTFCQETGIAAAPLPARPSQPEPRFSQGGDRVQPQQYEENRPQHSRHNPRNGSPQRQGWQQRMSRRPSQPQQRMNHQEPPGPSPQKRKRNVATWVYHELGCVPFLYCSFKPWKSQLQIETTLPEHDVPVMFRGRTLTALKLRESEALQPLPSTDCPEPRFCDVCGGSVINEIVHNKSKLHQERLEMDVELICSRIRRDPAFAAAVIGAARDCIERTGLGEAARDDEEEEEEEGESEDYTEDYVQPPPAKQQRVEKQPSDDSFGSLESEVFRREGVQKKKQLMNMGVQA